MSKGASHKKNSLLPYEQIEFVDTSRNVWNYSLLTAEDIQQYQQGTHYRLYEKMGSHALQVLGTWGVYFCVWAPNARKLSVIGNFNNWKADEFSLYPRWDNSGVWEGFIPGFKMGEVYKYNMVGYAGRRLDKGDPFANFWERRPQTASITWNLAYSWQDQAWMKNRKKRNSLQAPWSVYELHLASWQRPDKFNEDRYNSYDTIREQLIPYIISMGFTHVEFMPVMEHPFDGSWGYQCTGFFAPTSRFGDPQGLMRLIDALHQAEIGVIFDWVPSHFPYDAQGLFLFDGAHTYEYADMRKGFHPDWNSYIFNYKKGEVKSFLISSARFWFDLFHIDGIRVDAVTSMLKLNYSRKKGEWEPNELGGDGNLEAMSLLKDLNETIYRDYPDVQTIAEEATDWPGVSRPTGQGGLGFGMKWMMGWMHDTLDYFKQDAGHRPFHQDKFSFSMMYYYQENFMLPLSHDEVVHGKSPLIYKMSGDEWQKFANLRLLYTYMWTHPGAKLLFMGNEFGQTSEWDYRTELKWDLLQYAPHQGLKNCVAALNQLLRTEPSLYQQQFETSGFEWVDLGHRAESVIAYKRIGKKNKDQLLIILNLSPVGRATWEIETVGHSFSKILFNSNQPEFGGTDGANNPAPIPVCLNKKEKRYQLTLPLPALGAIVLR